MLEKDKDRLIISLIAKIDELSARLLVLEERCAILEIENKELRERLRRYETPKNSTNSSLPPSSDMYKPKSNQSLRIASGKKVGGQLGHQGKTLEMVSNPDHVVEHKPLYCGSCGLDLQGLPLEQVGRRQIIDIPPIRAQVTEHRLYNCSCRCGYLTEGTYPTGVNSPISYGERITSLIGYLHTRQYLPFKRMEELFRDVFGTCISEGGLHYLLAKLRAKSEPLYQQIKSRLQASTLAVGADETSMRVLGENQWAWTWQNKALTFIALTDNRGQKSVQEHFSSGFDKAVLVHDCWHSHLNTPAIAHQLCMAHLLRDLNYLQELYTHQWPIQCKAVFKEALQLKKEMTADHYLMHNPKVKALQARLDTLLESQIPKEKEKLHTFQKRLRKYKEHLFTFLKHPKVPPDNNASERAIRNIKVKQKISGGFRASNAAQGFAVLRSIIDTAIKNQQNPLGALAAIAAH